MAKWVEPFRTRGGTTIKCMPPCCFNYMQGAAVESLIETAQECHTFLCIVLPQSTQLRLAATLAGGGVLEGMHSMAARVMQLGQAAGGEVELRSELQASCIICGLCSPANRPCQVREG